MVTTVSCIIPALNEEDNIEGLINSIFSQDLDEKTNIIEILVIDNASQDKTVALSRKNGAKVYIKPELKIGALRNFGAENSNGEILVFLDADNVLDVNVIQRIVENLKDDGTGAIGIPLRPYGNPTWVEKTWYYHIHTYKKGLNVAKAIASGAFGIKRKLFLGAGGFDERLKVGEDTELSQRIKSKGYQIFLDPGCIIYNRGFPKTLKEFLKVEIWHGDSIKSILIHKNIDWLSIYFLFCLGSVIFGVGSAIRNLPIWMTIFPLYAIIGPALLKAIKRRKRADLQFLQLLIIYVVYIIGRTISIIKI